MSIASDLIRGHIDTIILAQLTGEDSYGYQINRAIRIKTDNQYELKEATLYSAFKRLEDLRFIESYWGDESTGARRRYYTITDLGGEAYTSLLKDWQEAKILIDRLVEGNSKEVDYE